MGNEIKEIIDTWRLFGNDVIVDEIDLPAHPEYVYRISGQWKGWSDFLDVDASDEESYLECEKKDDIEDVAFAKMNGNLH